MLWMLLQCIIHRRHTQQFITINNIFSTMKDDNQTVHDEVITTYKQVYTGFQRIFCCKCFNCLQDEIILTSDVRKQTLQRMIKNYVIPQDDDALYDPIKLMIMIYLCEDESIPKKAIIKCRINPNVGIDTYRTDLEFYIPQLCNYLVFHNQLKNNYLIESIEKGCKLSYFFAHFYYFYINSLEKIVGQFEIQVFKKVSNYKEKFLSEMNKIYEGQMLNSVQYFLGEKIKTVPTKSDVGYMIKMYGTGDEEKIFQQQVTAKDISLPNYQSIFALEEESELYSFKSTINFFEDLFQISEDLKNFENKKEQIKIFIQKVNNKLPASVYIPFVKNSNCFYNVLNIAYQETKIFSTKQRAPFYLCIEVFCPAETLSKEMQKKFWIKGERPLTLKQNLYSESLLGRRVSDENDKNRNEVSLRTNPPNKRKMSYDDQKYSGSIQTEIFSERDSHYLTNKLLEFTNEMSTQPRLDSNQKSIEMKSIIFSKEIEKKFENIFGETEEEMSERIRERSIFSQLESWKLIHVMIKTGDNLKQEQFALQLISQFDYIFKLQKLPLVLTPYEVFTMGPDCGILEMVKDSITFDKLKKYLKTQFQKPYTLKEFFEIYFQNNLVQAKQTFLKSLAAYSLVMYFLQAKDRHNGNIMLHRSGKIFHIDFGFFLSNLPGKGVELERDCPFKLLSEYIDVLDGTDSYYFKKFRQYLFLGFKAVRKHQNKILMLVKMMFSSSGMTMPCFEKGQLGIKQIEDRFNPEDVITDAQLNLHCQKLIDSSLDNWATKWYDRFQYFAQGIFY